MDGVDEVESGSTRQLPDIIVREATMILGSRDSSNLVITHGYISLDFHVTRGSRMEGDQQAFYLLQVLLYSFFYYDFLKKRQVSNAPRNLFDSILIVSIPEDDKPNYIREPSSIPSPDSKTESRPSSDFVPELASSWHLFALDIFSSSLIFESRQKLYPAFRSIFL